MDYFISLAKENLGALIIGAIVFLFLLSQFFHSRSEVAAAHAKSLSSIGQLIGGVITLIGIVAVLYAWFGTNGVFLNTPMGEYAAGIITPESSSVQVTTHSSEEKSREKSDESQATKKTSTSPGKNEAVRAVGKVIDWLTQPKDTVDFGK